MEDIEQTPPEKSAEGSVVAKAEKLFIKASTKYSGLTEAQIAYTALAAQDLGCNPLELRDTLLSEAGKTQELTDLANAMHEKHRPQLPTERWKRIVRQIKIYFQGEEEPRVVTENDVVRVINDIFTVAAKRITVDPGKLREILDLYPEYKNKNLSHAERQDAYSRKVDEILSRPDKEEPMVQPAARDKSIPRR